MTEMNELQTLGVLIFQNGAKVTSLFVLPLFLLRAFYSNILGEGFEALTAMKGVLCYFLLVAGFPTLLEFIFSIPSALVADGSINQHPNHAYSEVSSSSIIPFTVTRILELFLAIAYWLMYYLHLFLMVLLCAIAPLIFLLGGVLGIGFGISMFFALLILASAYPIIWYGLDSAQSVLIKLSPDGFGLRCLELLVTLLKAVAPLSLALQALKSAPVQAASKILAHTRWVSRTELMRLSSAVSSGQPNRQLKFQRSLRGASAFEKNQKRNEKKT